MEPVTAAPDSNPPGELYCTACERTYHIGERCPNDGTRLLKLKARIDPFLGRDLDGRYTVLEKLGSGGMGAVYRAEQHSTDREVAIKVVNSSLVSEPEVIKRFLREAKLASKLTHPNAVGVLDFGQTARSTTSSRPIGRSSPSDWSASGSRSAMRSRARTSSRSSTAISSPPTSC